MVIHKSQGGTFSEIVYEYSKDHSQELVNVALSRITNIENSYIVTPQDDPTKFKFYLNRKQGRSTEQLLQEFQRLLRLSLNTLQSRTQILLDRIFQKKNSC